MVSTTKSGMPRSLARGVGAAGLALCVILAWSVPRKPEFSWEGRLPNRYRLRAFFEGTLFDAARRGQRDERSWIYDSPDGLAQTLHDLKASFPRARIRSERRGVRLLLDGPYGPSLLVRENEGQVVVVGHSERVDPNVLIQWLAPLVPTR